MRLKIRKNSKFILTLFVAVFCLGCVKRQPYKFPPVKDGWRKTKSIKSGYIVQPKDSLYSIAWAFGMDHRELAAINNLQSPYKLKPGQQIKITGAGQSQIKQQLVYKAKDKWQATNYKPLHGWKWPTTGKIKLAFNKGVGGNKGIDIGGNYGQQVVASYSGKIVYCGTGIRSYGNLIIIKHNEDYLSAYAYNASMLVREGQEVKTGQKIATLGKNNEGEPRLHFEIRLFGKPVDPIDYLPQKS